jgi:hypothetical protein
VATIPLADMQAATTTIKGLAIESGAATTVYYDVIKLVGAAASSTSATTYAYDHADSRVKLTEGSTTTYFPNKFYEQQGTTGQSSRRHLNRRRAKLDKTYFISRVRDTYIIVCSSI